MGRCVAEMVIAFGLMTVVLATANHPRLMRYTGLFAGTLVATKRRCRG